jgi:DNA-binding winged helix-turn-helix (wHTH) protein
VHCVAPRLDPLGQIWHRGAHVRLSPTEERLASVLLERFGEVVPHDRLLDAGWEQTEASRGALRIHLTRLRRRIRPLGLEIRSRRGAGHVMHDANADAPSVIT